MTARRLVYMPLGDLKPAKRNSKGHDSDLIRSSVGRFGFIDVPVIDERTGRLVGGHGRRKDLLARKAAGDPPPEGVRVSKGEWLVPVVRGWSSTDDTEAEAAGIALNQSTIAGGFIPDTLADALKDLARSPAGFDGVGFEQADLDQLLYQATQRDEDPDDPREPLHVPPLPARPVTKPGDLWILGEHRLLCGDCRDPEIVVRALDGQSIHVAITSPPYAKQRDYEPDSGFEPIHPDEYVEWFEAVQANVATHITADGSWFVNIKPSTDVLDTQLYVHDLVAAHVREWGWHFATEFCWERLGVPKSVTRRFKNQFEPVYQFTRGEWKMRPDAVRHYSGDVPQPQGPGTGDTTWSSRQGVGGVIEQRRRPRPKPEPSQGLAVRQGRTGGAIDPARGDWIMDELTLAYPGNRLPSFSGTHEATGHPAAFPVGLPAFFALAFSDAGDVIFDPFVGSGSSLLAAHQTGRRGVGIELSTKYCDVAAERYQRTTGALPVLERTGKPVDLVARRAKQAKPAPPKR